ncbi:hypothetical protein [Allokutzneria sp. NRRL B-24872]|uniref:hypothetical protein n=1 Tax=Allokutzneria sp. NRRL B-24872 TaxID=1137961 RepID=UPI000A374826|nr:hypothetical protein [Allokutzneria sp. NRRL B-24872]
MTNASPLNEEEIRDKVRAAMLLGKQRKAELRNTAPAPVVESTPETVLLPVLRSTSRHVPLLDMPSFSVIPGALSATLAEVWWTPEKRIRMRHITRAMLGGRDFDALAGEAVHNLMDAVGVRVSEDPDPDPDKVISLERAGLAASAVAAPSLRGFLTTTLKSQDVLIALPCPDKFFAARADSRWAESMREMVVESGYEPDPLVPSLIRMDGSGMRVIAQRPGG